MAAKKERRGAGQERAECSRNRPCQTASPGVQHAPADLSPTSCAS